MWADRLRRLFMPRKKPVDFNPNHHAIVAMDGTSVSCSCGTVLKLQDYATLALSFRYRTDKLLDLWLLHEKRPNG